MRFSNRWLLSLLLLGCGSQATHASGQASAAVLTDPPTETYGPAGTVYGAGEDPNAMYDDYTTYDTGPTYTDVSTAPVGFDIPDVAVFYDQLGPYGQWTDDPVYGYVFVPQAVNFIPYTNGYWAFTDYGLTWISNDPFGWATS